MLMMGERESLSGKTTFTADQVQLITDLLVAALQEMGDHWCPGGQAGSGVVEARTQGFGQEKP